MNWKAPLLSAIVAGSGGFYAGSKVSKPEPMPQPQPPPPQVEDYTVYLERQACPTPPPPLPCPACKCRTCPPPIILTKGNCNVDWEKGTISIDVPKGKDPSVFTDVRLRGRVMFPNKLP